jgi:PKD repeat protein
MRGLLVLLALCWASALGAAVSINGPTALPATAGTPFTCAIDASGDGPLLYAATGLPTGLAINQATGRITGTPTTAGTYTVSLGVDGGAEGSASGTLEITVGASASTVPASADDVVVSAGAAMSWQILAVGTGASFIAIDLPGGLSMDSTGLISGQAFAAGIANVQVSADDGTTFTTMVVQVVPVATGAPIFALPVQPRLTVGAPAALHLAADGATSFGASNLPAWLSLDAVTGLVAGTPTAAGAANLRLTAAIGSASASTVLALPIAAPAAGDPVPASPAVLDATVGSGLAWRATAAAAATWSADGLPSGLTFDRGTGLLTGVPDTAGTATVQLTATPTGTGSPAATPIAIRIRAAATDAPQISAVVAPSLTAGAPAALRLDATPAATSWAMTGSTAFAIDAKGLITGTPASAGAVVLRISASNAFGTARTTVLLNIAAADADAPLPGAPVLLAGTAGSAFAAALRAASAVETWTVSTLPSGLFADPVSGFISGEPSVDGFRNLSLSAADTDGANATHAVIQVAAGSGPAITAAGPWRIGAGQPARIRLQATPTPDASAWSVSGLPTGLTRSGASIAGSVATATVANLDLRAGATRTAALIIVEAHPAGAPVIADPGALTGIVGTPFSATLTASPAATEWSVSGGPAWLALVPATGALSGTPTAAGTWQLQVAATNASGTVRTTMSLTVTNRAGSLASPPVDGVSGGGCSAGAAGLLLLALFALLGGRLRR